MNLPVISDHPPLSGRRPRDLAAKRLRRCETWPGSQGGTLEDDCLGVQRDLDTRFSQMDSYRPNSKKEVLARARATESACWKKTDPVQGTYWEKRGDRTHRIP